MKRALCILGLLAGGIAHADPAAEQLFRDGKRLVAKGKLAEACDRFERSQKLEPRIGTLLNLGDCYERIGRTASAWEAFMETNAMASAAKDRVRATEASRRANVIKPKLAYLTITIEHPPAGFELRRNAAVVDAAAWNVAVPIDPGKYELAATAPDHEPWSQSTTIAAGQPVTVVIALVKRLPAPPEGPPSEPPPKEPAPVVTASALPPLPPTDVVAAAPSRPQGRWAIGASAGETSDFDPIFGARVSRGVGPVRLLVAVRYDKFADDSSNGFSKSNQVLFGGGVEYVWLTPRFSFAVGATAGLDVLFRNSNRGTDAAPWWGVRASPLVLRLLDGQLEAGVHLEGVQTTDRLAAFAVVGFDWFLR